MKTRYRTPCMALLGVSVLCYFLGLYITNENIYTLTNWTHLDQDQIYKVLIVSQARSGSSFLGDLIRSSNTSFYFFEPLLFLENNRDYNKTVFMDDLFNCKFGLWREYFEFFRMDRNLFFPRNDKFWAECKNGTDDNCFNATWHTRFCQNANYRVMKVIRLAPSEVNTVLAALPDIKMIYLIRDPRGTMRSRHNLGWCKDKGKDCKTGEELCSNLRSFLTHTCLIHPAYSDRLLALRYEDLACHPEEMTNRIMSFLGVPEVPLEVLQFLRDHTNRTEGGPYETVRDSRLTAFAWQESISPRSLRIIQSHCSDVISILGFKTITKSKSEDITCDTSSASDFVFLGTEEDPGNGVVCSRVNQLFSESTGKRKRRGHKYR